MNEHWTQINVGGIGQARLKRLLIKFETYALNARTTLTDRESIASDIRGRHGMLTDAVAMLLGNALTEVRLIERAITRIKEELSKLKGERDKWRNQRSIR